MSTTRRIFVCTLGLGGAAAFTRPAPAWGQTSPAAGLPVAAPDGGVKLDGNENAHGPSPAAFAAVQAAMTRAARYPRNLGDLMEAIAKHHGVVRENVLLGCGSGELLRAAVPAFTAPDRALATALPTFELPAGAAQRLKHPLREVPVDAQLRVDLGGLEAAARGAGLLYVCNPNNPTAGILPARDLAALLERLREMSPATTVLVDEAYHHYVSDPAYASLAARAAREPHLVVTRTFSKVYALAGLRVGYAIATKETLDRLKAQVTSSLLPVTSVAAALACLHDEANLEKQVQLNRGARDFTRRVFEDAGFTVAPSEANFLMVDVRRDAAEFQAACRAEGVLIGRPFPPLQTWSRVTIGTMDEMQQAAPIFRAVLAKPAASAA